RACLLGQATGLPSFWVKEDRSKPSILQGELDREFGASGWYRSLAHSDSFLCNLVQMSIAFVGSIAPFPSSMCWILPCLSTTKVVRLANCICSFRMPYSFETWRVISLSSGNLTPIFSANAWLEGGASMLMPNTAVSLRSILPDSIPDWYA